MVPKVASRVLFLYKYLVLQDRLLYFLLRKSKHLELQSTKYHLNFIFGAWTLKQKNRVANLILEETYTSWGIKNDAPFEAELFQSSSSATACLWTIVFFPSTFCFLLLLAYSRITIFMSSFYDVQNGDCCCGRVVLRVEFE